MNGAATLETWLRQVTCRLSAESSEQVRSEIQDHFDSAREEALAAGVAPDEAVRTALESLGNPRAANLKYRKVMLTRAEAALLRESGWEARAVCRYRSLIVIPLTMVAAGVALLASRPDSYLGLVLTIGGAGMSLLFGAPMLPINTPTRARVFRILRWVWYVAIFAVACWPTILRQMWFIVAIGWPIMWVEMTMASIRRKLPTSQWPRQLYF
jgi:hypothetical protein